MSAKRIGPPKERYATGPKCDGCLHRGLSRGYAPISCPTVRLDDTGGTVVETGEPLSEFLFIMEALGADEVELGRNAVGPTGNLFDKLLREQTPLRRQDVALLNPVRCRPIAFDGDKPATLDYNKDNVTQKPSFDQIRECCSRYFDEVIEKGDFKRIVCLGGVAAYAMLGRQVEISKFRGTIFEPGRMKKCTRCLGSGKVESKARKCKVCKGRGQLKCSACGGVSKHRKKCTSAFSKCESCTKGMVPGPLKPCRECGGAGEVPEDPSQPHVCKKLKPGQLMMITYHPAYLMRNPGMWPVVERDFQRLTEMEEELSYAASAVYDEYPPVGVGISAEIVSGDSKPDFAGLATGNGDYPITIDLETTGLDADSGKITHFAFTDRPGYGCVLRPDDERVRRLLQRPTLVGQNIVLFDWWWLERHGFKIPATTEIVDTRFLGKLVNPDTPNDLSYLTSELADPPLRGYWKAKDDYRRHIERVACIDVDATTRVLRGARERLERTSQWQFVNDYIIPISRVVFESRLAGMKVNKARMKDALGKIELALAERRAELPDWGGVIKSEGQHAKVQKWLYEVLQLPIQKKQGTWQPTAGRKALDDLKGLIGRNDKKVEHVADEKKAEALDFIDLLQELRDMSKLSTGFLRYEYSKESKVHPELNPLGTATLRPTCSDPNVLQVPSCKCKPPCHGTEKHKCPGSSCTGTNPRCKNARWVFIPDQDDWEIMSVDLSQAEVIGFLWYAEQWSVLDEILNKGQDAYQIIANKIFGREASAQERDQAKVDTLAFIYGEGDNTQALRLRLSVEDIKRRREVYLAALPGVRDFRDQIIRSAMQRGFVESPWGVRRYIRVDRAYGRAANEACNAPIQNICPMITGHAMIKLHAQLPKPARLWTAWVYDEINFVYPKEMRLQVYEAAREILGAPVKQMPARPIGMGDGLRFRLDFATGDDWGHLRKMEVN